VDLVQQLCKHWRRWDGCTVTGSRCFASLLSWTQNSIETRLESKIICSPHRCVLHDHPRSVLDQLWRGFVVLIYWMGTLVWISTNVGGIYNKVWALAYQHICCDHELRWKGVHYISRVCCLARGHQDWKKRPGVDFFFFWTLGGLTNYVIRHMSKYSNITSSARAPL